MEKHFDAFFGPEAPAKGAALCQILSKYESIVAGGFMTNVVAQLPQTATDIDIYVPAVYHMQAVRELVSTFDLKLMQCHLQPSYDTSFLRQNKIVLRYAFEFGTGSVLKHIDVMITEKSPQDVASNFDLTCCQVWFDGSIVSGTHLDETMQRTAYLNPEYYRALQQGNQFTINRLFKYIKRGFSVSFHPGPEVPETPVTIVEATRAWRSRLAESPETFTVKWLTKLWIGNSGYDSQQNIEDVAYDTLPGRCRECNDILNRSVYIPSEWTFDALRAVVGDDEEFHDLAMKLMRYFARSTGYHDLARGALLDHGVLKPNDLLLDRSYSSARRASRYALRGHVLAHNHPPPKFPTPESVNAGWRSRMTATAAVTKESTGERTPDSPRTAWRKRQVSKAAESPVTFYSPRTASPGASPALSSPPAPGDYQPPASSFVLPRPASSPYGLKAGTQSKVFTPPSFVPSSSAVPAFPAPPASKSPIGRFTVSPTRPVEVSPGSPTTFALPASSSNPFPKPFSVVSGSPKPTKSFTSPNPASVGYMELPIPGASPPRTAGSPLFSPSSSKVPSPAVSFIGFPSQAAVASAASPASPPRFSPPRAGTAMSTVPSPMYVDSAGGASTAALPQFPSAASPPRFSPRRSPSSASTSFSRSPPMPPSSTASPQFPPPPFPSPASGFPSSSASRSGSNPFA